MWLLSQSLRKFSLDGCSMSGCQTLGNLWIYDSGYEDVHRNERANLLALEAPIIGTLLMDMGNTESINNMVAHLLVHLHSSVLEKNIKLEPAAMTATKDCLTLAWQLATGTVIIYILQLNFCLEKLDTCELILGIIILIHHHNNYAHERSLSVGSNKE